MPFDMFLVAASSLLEITDSATGQVLCSAPAFCIKSRRALAFRVDAVTWPGLTRAWHSGRSRAG
eukprot:2379653-Rhodomonas_salina.2